MFAKSAHRPGTGRYAPRVGSAALKEKVSQVCERALRQGRTSSFSWRLRYIATAVQLEPAAEGMSSLQHLFRWNGWASLSVTDRIVVLRYESAIKELRCPLLLTKNLSRPRRLRST
jgi:hypothetical protein